MKIDIIKLCENDKQEIDTIANWFDNWYEWEKPYWTFKRIRNRLTTMSKSDRIPAVFVAKVDGQIVATCGIDRFDDTKKTPKYYPWIVNAFVKQEFRGKGIYKQLLAHAYEHLSKLKYKTIYIRTDWENLYEKLGWKFVKKITLDNGRIERLYAYELSK
ncbi:MAG: GNAT family N-acetyltransferase [Clostridia bacterium]|nr:GNAT family N-acetyltransferase [Clostridia bacterium]